jgi:hypothetical protein
METVTVSIEKRGKLFLVFNLPLS